jgi:3-hydroxybutyryl-CoA dehydrogenase
MEGGRVSVPQDYLDRPVAVIGAGTLGRRVALMFATRGGLVRIHARRAENGAAAVDFVEQQIDGLAGTHPGWARGRAEHVARLEDAVADAWLVIESVPERLELKQEVFAQLESAAPRDTILASNSSSYASRLIVDGLSTTHRMLNTHFYMPPTQIAVDVMSCGNTSQEVLEFVLATFPRYGLRPFLVRRESTGFIFNRIWAAIKREALDVVAAGVSTPDDVDEMWKLMFGTKIGPFRAMDLVGLDVVYDIEEHYAAEYAHLPPGPRELLRHYIDAGKLGAKTGAGFYADYPKPQPQD